MSETDWKRPYRCLAVQHFVLVTFTGVVIVLSHQPFWSQYLSSTELDYPWLLLAVLLYAVLDLIRIPFTNGSVVSLGFPIVLYALLMDANPTTATLIVVAGSLLSESVYAYFSRRLTQQQALMRAVLYAGHHAAAGFCAGIAFLLLHTPVDQAIEDWLAIVAYVLVYGTVSTIVLWPHDWWVSHLLAPEEERLPRAEIILTVLVMTPIPIVLNYLYNLVEGSSRSVVYFLPLLFLALLLLARSFAKAEVENAKSRTGERARAQIGSPPNLAELTRNVFNGAHRLVKYQWGAIYSYGDDKESFHLRGHRRADGLMETYGLRARKKNASGTKSSLVGWPDVVKLREGFLGEVVQQGIPQVTFGRTKLAAESSLCLPAYMALMVLPLHRQEIGEEGTGGEGAEEQIIGLLALARPNKLFTLTERNQAQALTGVVGNTLFLVQRLESKLQALYKEIERFRQPEFVQQALDDLIRLGVDVPRLMAAISEKSLNTNLRAVLQSVIDGPGEDEHLVLPPDVLREIYHQVRGEAEGMPELTPEIMSKLQRVTSALSLGFTFHYQCPEFDRGPEYKNLYKVLQQALNASTVPDIVPQGDAIKAEFDKLKDSSVAARDQIRGQLKRLEKIVASLEEAEDADADARIIYLGKALRQLEAAEQSVHDELDGSERFTFGQVAVSWQTVVTNALYAAREGGAQLAMRLSSNQALPVDEITVQLRLENKGPGLASQVVAEIKPSQDYRIGDDGGVALGPLPAGDSREVDFKIKPHSGRKTLRLVFQITYRDRERREKSEEFADCVYLRKELPPFTEIDNPYLAGRALGKGSPLFFGRDDVFKFIRRNIAGTAKKRQVLLLVGERRTGKTSIVKQLPERLKDEPYIHVFFDCQRIADPGMAGFFLRLSGAIAWGLREADLSVEHLSPDDLKSMPQYVFEERFLPQVWQCIGDRSLLLAVDEFEALEARVQEGQLEPVVFDYLRSLIQDQEKMTFIFVGTHRVEELAADYQSVLFNIAKPKRISFLDRESAVQLITKPVLLYGVTYDELALNEVLRLTAGHPYFLQLICDCLTDHCNDQKRNYVTIQDVRDVRDEIIALGREHVLFVWQESSPAEKAVLAALTSLLRSKQQVAAADIVEHLAERIGSLTDHPTSFDLWAVTQALEHLSNRDIVQEISGATLSYRFTAHLYCELISKYKSLNKVVPELIREIKVPPEPER